MSDNQMTREQAIAFSESGAWEKLELAERGRVGLTQELLCMPFDKLHEGVEALLGRSVWTHEFADRDALIAEAKGDVPKRSFADILALISADKLVIVATGGSDAR